MKRLWIFAALFILLAALTGCGSPEPSITGQLSPWTNSTPIEGREILLCRALDEDAANPPFDCELLDTVASSDSEGMFEFAGVPEGTYYLLYDSGLGDFDATLEEWAGKTLEIGDNDWFMDFLNAESNSWLRLNLPEGFPMGMGHDEWNMEYIRLTLQFGASPFVLEHDVQAANTNNVVNPTMVEVINGETAQANITVVYYGD